MPPADGNLTRGGSTFVRGRVRSPHMATLQATSVPIAWDSCAMGQTDVRTAVSLNTPVRRGHNITTACLVTSFGFPSEYVHAAICRRSSALEDLVFLDPTGEWRHPSLGLLKNHFSTFCTCPRPADMVSGELLH